MLDDILFRDVGACNDLVLRDGNAYFSTGWTAFVTANRLHEQLLKRATPDLQPKREGEAGIGHLILKKWFDVLAAEQQQRPFFEQMNIGYSWFQALFQTPWQTLRDLYQEVESTQNEKEYTLHSMPEGTSGTGVHPLLPCALADVISMLSDLLCYGQDEGDGLNIRTKSCSIHRIGSVIGRELTEVGCVNLNVELMNAVYSDYGGEIGVWSRLFHDLKGAAMLEQTRETMPLFYGDAPHLDGSTISRPTKGRYVYDAKKAESVLARMFRGDVGVVEAHRRWGGLLLGQRDWRLQLFRRISEHCPLERREDGVWHDRCSGAWQKSVDWGWHRPKRT